jgi:hypothetical protein
MTYEAWRISFQDSEQAARSAYCEVESLSQRIAALEQEKESILEGYEVVYKAHKRATAELLAFRHRAALEAHAFVIELDKHIDREDQAERIFDAIRNLPLPPAAEKLAVFIEAWRRDCFLSSWQPPAELEAAWREYEAVRQLQEVG